MFVRLAVPALLASSLIALADDASKTVLLDVRKGQVPPDTGLDNKTTPKIVTDVNDLGGKALKVAFAPGDSFGSKSRLNQDWSKYASFRFDAVNPGKNPVDLELDVIHAKSTSRQTRVIVPINLKPGKNEVKIGIGEMANVDKSAADLARVSKWYIADTDGKGPTVYFGDIWLEAVAAGGALPDGGVRIDPARLERIKSAKMPAVTAPVLFDTPEADAILAALEVFPPNNPWNQLVDEWPLHPRSAKIVAAVGANKPFRANPDMCFVLVPPGQKKVDVRLTEYPNESDKGPFPVPDNTPIEGWPVGYKAKKVSLEDVQRNTLKEEDADRHGIVVDPVNRMLYEFYRLKKVDGGWSADQASVFDLKSNRLRPDGWTSADAAGLPIFPAVVRYDELKRGVIDHALRVTVRRTRREYIYPATHFASRLTDEDLPRMGERFRLRKDFDVSGFSPEVKTILTALIRYGMFVADNGIEWAISTAPDPRIPSLHVELRKVKGSDFEVVQPPPGYIPPK